MKEERIQSVGAYLDAATLNSLTDALRQARSLLETEGTPATEQASILIEDAERMLEKPRKDKVQLGSTDDIKSEQTRKLLLEIVRLFSDSASDELTFGAIKKLLGYSGVAISGHLDRLVEKGYIERRRIGQSYEERLIRLTDKTKTLIFLIDPEA